MPAHKRIKAKRGKKLEELPVEEEIIEPAETTCSCCNSELTTIGKEESKTLEYTPPKLFVKNTIRIKKACNKCKESGVKIAPLRSIMPGSFASASLLTNMIVAKYQDCLPLHRQEQMFERLGYKLERKLMTEWVQRAAETYFARVAVAIKCQLLIEDYLQADETPLEVQDRNKVSNITTGYIWGMLGPPGVYFEYSESRSQQTANSLFGSYTGALQTDLYVGYNKINCTRLACMAHIRRKFVESPDCAEKTKVLSLIAQLYAVEKKAKTVEQLAKLREKQSAYTLNLVKTELEKIKDKFTPESDIVKAANYALKQWAEVLNILKSPKYALDNNAMERQIRTIAIGRKNWLFAGSHRGAKNAAIIFTILGSCKLAGVNPVEFLNDLFSRVLDHPVNRMHEFTPANWKAAKSA